MRPYKDAIHIFILVLLATTGGCNEQTSENSDNTIASEDESKTRYLREINDSFHWLMGDWHLMDPSAEILEVWLALDDTMKGYTFERINGEPVLIDLMSLSNRDSVTYLNAMPIDQNDGKTTSFALTVFTENMARFENPEHDFPQWFEFFRTSDSTLNVQYGTLTNTDRISKFYILE